MRSPAQQRALDRHELWRTRYADRLAAMHPDLRAETESTVRERFLAGNFEPLSDEDRRRCLMRAASRLRIMDGTPAGAPGSGEQLRAVVARMEDAA